MKNITILLLAFLTILSCKKDDDGTTTFGNVALEFKNTIDNIGIELLADTYTNASNENYKISELKYIISNIVLIKANGEEVKYPVDQSYFLIDENVLESKKIVLEDINAGEYTKIKFGFGVDQSKYPFESGMANFIPTAEENGMLWNWAAGYKFLKFEGTFSIDGVARDNPFVIHVGSHGTNIDNYKEITLDLPSALKIAASTSPEVAINADISKIFDSTNTHSLAIKSDVQLTPEFSPKIAENVSTIFNITGLTN